MTVDGPEQAAVGLARDRRVIYALGVGVFLAAGVALVSYAAKAHPKSPPGPGLIAGMVGAFLGAIGCVILLAHNAQRVRVAALGRAAASLGFTPTSELSKEGRARAFGSFSSLGMLRSGAKGLCFHAAGERSGRRVEVMEHFYVVSTGKSAHRVTHSAAATACPASWPRVSLTPRGPFAKLWEAVAGKDLQLEAEAFNRRWTVKTETPDFAIVLLSPEVQQFLSGGDSHETWHVGGGSLCRVVRKRLKGDEMARAVDRTLELRNLIPRELDYWER